MSAERIYPKTYIERIRGIFILPAIMFPLFVIMALPVGNLLEAILIGFALTITLIAPVVVITIFVDWIFLQRVFKRYGKNGHCYSLRQERKVFLETLPEAIEGRVVSALKNIRGIRYIGPIQPQGTIFAQTRMGCLTWGQNIHVHILADPDSQNNVSVIIQSQPKGKYAAFDLGRNYRNVEHLAAAVRYAN